VASARHLAAVTHCGYTHSGRRRALCLLQRTVTETVSALHLQRFDFAAARSNDDVFGSVCDADLAERELDVAFLSQCLLPMMTAWASGSSASLSTVGKRILGTLGNFTCWGNFATCESKTSWGETVASISLASLADVVITIASIAPWYAEALCAAGHAGVVELVGALWQLKPTLNEYDRLTIVDGHGWQPEYLASWLSDGEAMATRAERSPERQSVGAVTETEETENPHEDRAPVFRRKSAKGALQSFYEELSKNSDLWNDDEECTQ
jgi:hypothetical protein